jgi:hypothetical protein
MDKIPTSDFTVDAKSPAAPSIDHQAMAPLWFQVRSIMGGTNAMRENAAVFLPRYPRETDDNYNFRRKNARFTNVYQDIVENLAQRPFAKEVVIEDDAPDDLHRFCEDVDGRGSTIHSFAGDVFANGINAGLDWILVDYTAGVPENATRAVEREIGARPFWCRYTADRVLAAESAMINGKEEFVHVRLKETVVERVGFEEKAVDQIRVLNREQTSPGVYSAPTWEIWQKRKDAQSSSETWQRTQGPTAMTVPVITLVPFLAGRRKGTSWQVQAPMEGAADLQIELFQLESSLKHIETLTAFPMLSANSVEPPVGEDGKPAPVPVGPHAVLYAPDGGSWAFIEPSAESLNFLREHIKDTTKELRELGRQPLTAQTGNLTVVTTAFAAQKANAAIQAWALNLKVALEQALRYTAMWLRQDPEVYFGAVLIDLDFDLGLGDDASFGQVMQMRRNGDISRKALITEAKRRNILTAEYDPDEDAEELAADVLDEPEEEEPSPGQPGQQRAPVAES